MKKLLTFAKGKLTNISLGAVVLDLVLSQEQILDSYTVATNTEVTLISLAGALGAIVGIARKFTKAYKEQK